MKDETREALENIRATLEQLNERVRRLEGGGSVQNTGDKTQKRISIKEFLLEHKLANEVERTLAIAYFLETIQGLSSLNKADIEKGYRAAKEAPPSNINDKVNMNIKNGHMMEAEEKKDSMKAWVLTGRGEEHVQYNLGSNNSQNGKE